jgi:hypothetical protein
MNKEILAADWACFGASIAAQAEQGINFHDLSPGNVGILDSTLRIIDMDCWEEYAFPGDIHVYATALFSLLGHIPLPEASGFRFGYIHHGGRFGRLVFDQLRHEFGLTPWGNPKQIPELARLSQTGWIEEHKDWQRRRDSLDLPELEDGAWHFPSLIRPERSSQTGESLRSSDSECAFHAFERRLIIELARNNPKDFLYAITDIGLLAAERGDKVRAGLWGLTVQALELDLKRKSRLWPDLVFWLPWTAEEEVRSKLNV